MAMRRADKEVVDGKHEACHDRIRGMKPAMTGRDETRHDVGGAQLSSAVMAGLVPATHDLWRCAVLTRKSWMAGMKPAMTEKEA
jgi:hypothetical protein